MNFSCPRTCPLVNEHWCRFRPVLDTIGSHKASSHTVRIKAEYQNKETLAAAIVSIGGKVLGEGTHPLFDSKISGFGFTLPGWQKNLVLQPDGQLAYDDYQGRWGNAADLERLKGEYVIQTAEQSAMALGWQTQRNGAELTVFHPNGGHMVVGANGAEAFGFAGVGCHSALLSLNLPMDQFAAKPEMEHVACEVQQGVG